MDEKTKNALRSALRASYNVLRSNEFAYVSIYESNCPNCGAAEVDGHKDTCTMQDAIAQVRNALALVETL